MGYIYRYLDSNDNTLYIGSTKRNIKNRINEHRREEYHNLSKTIEYSEVEENLHGDYESKLIDLYRPQFNTMINNIHYNNVDIKKINWIRYNNEILPIKNNGKKGKIISSKNNYINIKDYLLFNNIDIEKYCIGKIKSFDIRQQNFCCKSFCRDVSIFYIMLESNITPEECSALNLLDTKRLKLSTTGTDFINKYIVTPDITNYSKHYPNDDVPLFLSCQRKRITTRAIQILFKKYFIEFL